MQIGRYQIEQLSEGIFDVSTHGSIVKVRYQDGRGKGGEEQLPPPQQGFARIGLDPVLISDGRTRVLLDAGLGIGLDHRERDNRVSNLLTNLEIFGLEPADIDYVVLSHLHYDHAAGLTYSDRNLRTVATLSDAEFLIQKSEWEHALHSTEHEESRAGLGYELDELYRLVAEERFRLLEQERIHLLPGLEVIRTGGHTPGHQIVRIADGGDSAYFFGDLVPNEYQLNHYAMKRVDVDPTHARKIKMVLLKQAAHEKALLLFYHSLYSKSGRIRRDANRKYVLSGREELS